MVTALWGILSGALGGFAANYLIQYIRELQDRKRFSLLGVSIVEYLMAQLDLGIQILEQIAVGQITGAQLPNSAWNGMGTIPREVLLRIVSLAQRHRNNGQNGFPPKDILVHCNNYFVYICGQINSMLTHSVQSQPQQIVVAASDLQSAAISRLQGAKKVKSMLNTTRDYLLHNSATCFPK